MGYKLSFFNSVFELMTAYNFAYVGIKEIHKHTQYLHNIIRNLVPTKFTTAGYELAIRAHGLTVEEDIVSLRKLYNTISQRVIKRVTNAARRIDKPESVEQVSKKLSPIYLYSGFYCLMVICISGMMEHDDCERDRLFYFIHVYNQILLLPIAILLLRKRYEVNVFMFIALFLLHLAVSLLIWETSIHRFDLLSHDGYIVKLLFIIKNTNIRSALLIILTFFVYQIIYYSKEINSSNTATDFFRIKWKVGMNIILFCVAFEYVFYVKNDLKIHESWIVFETILCCFSPLVALVLRSIFGLIFITSDFLFNKIYLDAFTKRFTEELLADTTILEGYSIYKNK